MEEIEEIVGEIYECRLLVFLETDPQTNKYNQVILNQEQFKKVSDAVSISSKKDDSLREGFTMNATVLSSEEYDLPDLQSVN